MPNVNKLKEAYRVAKEIAIGNDCTCPSCGKVFVKKTKAQAFCGSKENTVCKDFYWNNVTPNKRNNKTRISPASAAYLKRQAQNEREFDYVGWYGGDEGWDFKDED